VKLVYICRVNQTNKMDRLKFENSFTIDSELLRVSVSVSTRDKTDYIPLKERQIEEMIQYAAAIFQVPAYEIRGISRKGIVPSIRQVLMWYFRTHLGMTLQSVGKLFRRDHATVVNACKVVGRKDFDTKMRKIFNQFMEGL